MRRLWLRLTASLTGNNLNGFWSTFLEVVAMSLSLFFWGGMYAALGAWAGYYIVQLASVAIGLLTDKILKWIS